MAFTLKQGLFCFWFVLSNCAGGSANYVTKLTCPACFKSNSLNEITVEIDQAVFSRTAACTSAQVVAFENRTGESLKTLCSSFFPPSSACADFTDNTKCDCVSQQDNKYTYRYRLLVDQNMLGSKITATVCLNLDSSLATVVGSCNSVAFENTCYTDPNCKHLVLVVLLLFFGLVSAIPSVVITAIHYFKQGKKVCEVCWVLPVVIALAVIAVVLSAVPIFYACDEGDCCANSGDSCCETSGGNPCDGECIASIVVCALCALCSLSCIVVIIVLGCKK